MADDQLSEGLLALKELLELRLALAEVLGEETSTDGGRASAMYALAGVLDHLSELGISEQLNGPLLELYKALDDVERRASIPKMFERPPKVIDGKDPGGRPPPTNDQLLVQVLATTGMELFMQAGESKADAAKLVARRMTHSELPLPDDFSAVTVTNWRDKMHREHGSRAAERHRKWLEAAKATGADPRTTAERILSGTSPIGAKT